MVQIVLFASILAIHIHMTKCFFSDFKDLVDLAKEIYRVQDQHFDLVQIFLDENSDLLDSVDFSDHAMELELSVSTFSTPPESTLNLSNPMLHTLSLIHIDNEVGTLPLELISSLPKGHPFASVWIILNTDRHISFDSLQVNIDSQILIVEPVSRAIFTIREIYAISRTEELVQNQLGTFDAFTLQIELDAPSPWNVDHFYARRKNLGGIKLKFLVDVSKPFCFIPSGPNGTHLDPYGVFIDILQALAEEFNFKLSFTHIPNSSWTAMIDKVSEAEYDGMAVDVAVNMERDAKVSFTIPLFVSDYRLVTKTPGPSLTFTTYTSTFSAAFWSALFANILVCSLFLYIVIKVEKSHQWNIWECLSMVCLAMVCIGLSRLPRKLSSRMLFLSSLLLGTVIWASYQASLTSTLTVVSSNEIVSDLNDVIRHDFHLGIWRGTVVEHYLKMSNVNSAAYKLYESDIKNRPENHYNNLQGFLRAKEDPRFGFLTVNTEAIYSEFYPCEIQPASLPAFKFQGAMAFRPGFESLGLFNHYLAKIQESGQFDLFMTRHLPPQKSCPPPDLAVAFFNIVSAFLMLSGGILVAIVLACSERLALWPKIKSTFIAPLRNLLNFNEVRLCGGMK